MGGIFGLVVISYFCMFDCGVHGFNRRVARANNAIDSYIFGLHYSPDQILTFVGESKNSVPVHQEGTLDENQCFIEISREKKTARNGQSDIGVVAANENRAFPGSLLLANQRLIDNTPDIVSLDRANLTYTINLPGLTEDGHFTIIPTFAEYQSAKEKTLKTWFEKYPNDHNVVANFESESTFAYSVQYLRVKFGLEFKNTAIESSIDFNAMNKQKKLIMIYRFKQIFYTVSVDPTSRPSELFAPSVTVEDLKRITDNSNPPVIVDSVSYGRAIYVTLETTSTDSEAKALLSTNGASFNLCSEGELKMKSKLKDINMRVSVLGGSTDQVQLISTQSFKEVNDILIKNAKFSRDNPGYPISYFSQFIKDNSRAVVQMATDYIETTRTVHCSGILKIVHKGWFVTKWFVTWKEVKYDKNGEKVTEDKAWSRNGKWLTSPFEGRIELPGNAQDIHVIAQESTGLLWEPWRTIIDRSRIPLISKRKFEVWGSTLSPKHKIEPAL